MPEPFLAPDDGESSDPIEGVGSILPVDDPHTNHGPSTDPDSRKTILRSERKDTISLLSIQNRFYEADIPDSYTVVQRTQTYYGPELLLAADDSNYRLTAPGPDTQLLLWGEITNERNYRETWVRLAEVQASIEDTSQYDICDQCGSPIRSQEHERLSAIDRCPRVANNV